MLLGLAVIATIVIAWFATLPGGTLMGDDLGFVWRDQHSGPWSIWGATKFRPVVVLLMAATIALFGSSYASYVGFNIAIELAITILVVFIALRLSSRNLFVSLGAGITFAVSRFSYFVILQMGGLMESLALGFTLLIVYDAIVAFQDNKVLPLSRLLLWYGLLIFTDERFIVVLPFVLACGLLHPQLRSNRRWLIAFLGSATAIFLANYFIKTAILHMHFLQGSARELGFDPGLILSFMCDGLLNIAGFNIGPDYLAARDVSETGAIGYALGSVTVIPIIAAIVAFGLAVGRGRVLHVRQYLVMALVLFLPLLLSASVSFRQEPRFLYAPYAIALIGLAAIAGVFRDRQTSVRIVSAVFIFATVTSTVYYRHFLGNVYYEYSERIAETVRSSVTNHPRAAVVIVTHGEPSIEQYIFQDHTYFDVYGIAAPIIFVDNVSQVRKLVKSVSNVAVFDISGDQIEELPPNDDLAAPLPPLASGTPKYSFVARYDTGAINSQALQSTPSGRGAFTINWPYSAKPIESLTVVAGFRYSYPHVPIARNDELSFIAAAPYAIGTGARAFIEIVDHGRTQRLFAGELLPALPSGPRWARFSISLDRFAGHHVTVIFGADYRGADPRAAWVVYGQPEIRSRGKN